ncbi:hypothetical protein LTR53_002427 [Teratosphaeriaceae sp. CCFEE 6253]|nr:hypothetical protein LTR53_002427 [Teratosphaeriaceae sp. CCFEE 6253]
MAMANETRSAFFYGTLMAPQVLHRVCHGSSNPENPLYATHQLKTHPAVLHDYRRHRVQYADYPAILPVAGASVRGTYVTGFTDEDIRRLDIFEGGQYRRDGVKPRLLTKEGTDAASGKGNEEGEEVEAETYVWIADAAELEDQEWDFAVFQREKMRYWTGSEGAGEYAEVDEAVAADEKQRDGTGGRGANGHIWAAVEKEQQKDEGPKDVRW